MEQTGEPCPICLDNIGNESHTLPECSHKFHTNCIMTWFRAGHKCCPLCRNGGVNNTSSQSINLINTELSTYSWMYRKKLLHDDYIKMRRLSRKKDAPKELKKKVQKLKRMELKYKNITKELSVFIKSKFPLLTVVQIRSKGRKIQRKKWKLKRAIVNMKQYIGLTNKEIQLIIPIKVNV
jgi:hypothetical protein